MLSSLLSYYDGIKLEPDPTHQLLSSKVRFSQIDGTFPIHPSISSIKCYGLTSNGVSFPYILVLGSFSRPSLNL